MTRFLGYEGTATMHTVPSGENPFQFKNSLWLVGYWEDFSVSYSSSEANSNDLTHDTTHFGNPMNAEARLNPYYRWSFPDRANRFQYVSMTLPDGLSHNIKVGNMRGLITSDIKRLHNLGAFEHISIDTIRLGGGSNYASILQHEYIDSNAQSNRFKYGGLSYEPITGSINAGRYYDSYIMFNPSYSSAGRYYASSGDTDITNGRSDIIEHSMHDLNTGTAADGIRAGNYKSPTVPHGQWPSSSYLMSSTRGGEEETTTGFKKTRYNTMVSTAGRFNFTAVRDEAYNVDGVLQAVHGGVAWARSGDGRPKVISADIKSPSGKPFLVCQQSFPSNHVIQGQVFSSTMGLSFATVGFGGQDGQWTTGDLTWSAPNDTSPTGTDLKEYSDLREGDIVRSPLGWTIVQAVYPDDKSLSLYSLDAGALINPNLFNPSHAQYLGFGAALDRVPITRKYWPVVNYDGPLNTASDGDVFHMRFCPQHLDRDGNADAQRSLHYVLKVGYDKDQILWTERGNRYKQTGSPIMPNHFNACVELDLELGTLQASKANDPNNLGSYTSAPRRHQLYDFNSGNTASHPQHSEAYIDYDENNGVFGTGNYESVHNMWIDLDVVFDFTNQKYELYVNGKRNSITKSMLAKPDGTPWVASDLHGWHLDAIAFPTSFSPQTNTYQTGQHFQEDDAGYLATLIDRVGVIRELTNPVNDVGDSTVPTTNTLLLETNLTMELDRTGILTAKVADDDNKLHLQRIMKETTSDWKVMLFGDDIDDFVWFGDIASLNVSQDAWSKTKEISIQAEDSLNQLDKVMPYWEVGQSAYGPSTTYAYRRKEAEMATENFYFGTRRLLRSNQGLGLDHQTRTISKWDNIGAETGAISGDYSPLYEQRMRLYSAHPIQMYSGEESDGSLISMDTQSWKTSPTVLDWRDNIWNMWSTRRIIGFSDGQNHTWDGQDPADLKRGIIAHCIEHNLRVGDTFEIGAYVGGTNANNPFTFSAVSGENKRTIVVKKIIDEHNFVFVYPLSDTDFGPLSEDKGSYWSVIRRKRSNGGFGPAIAGSNHLSFWSATPSSVTSSLDDEGFRDSVNWLTQITTKDTNADEGQYDGRAQRIEVDGRLLSPFHTTQNVAPQPAALRTAWSGANGHGSQQQYIPTDVDDRVFVLSWDFGRYFMNSPWSGMNSQSEIFERTNMDLTGMPGLATASLQAKSDYRFERYKKVVDLASYEGGVTVGGWAKYRGMNFKPAVKVNMGAETASHYNQFLDQGEATPSYPAGSQYGIVAEDHHGLMCVGPAWIFANQHGATGLQYLNKGSGEERSQVFTMVSMSPQYVWGGGLDGARNARIYGYDSNHRNYRNAFLLRGNDIDQVDPSMPTTTDPHSIHPAYAGSGQATRRQDSMFVKADDGSNGGEVHGGGGWQRLRLAYNSDSRWSQQGTIGLSDIRWNIPVASLNTTAVTSDPDLTTGNAPADWDTVKLLLPLQGEIAIQSNLPANTVGGPCVTYTYESFDDTTDTFINCRPLKAAHRSWDPTTLTGVKHIRLCIPAIESHCQAVFIPPTNRQQRQANRVSHAAWMQDIRNSLWFKMVFGRINKHGLGVDGPKRGALAIRGDADSPHNSQSINSFPTAGQHQDFFTLSADAEAGATTMRLTPSCGIPMVTPDGEDLRFKSAWGNNLREQTDPWVSIPSYASNTNPARKNGGLCVEIYSNNGSIDIGMADEAQMVSCRDSRDPAFKHWEIVSIREEELIADGGLLEEYGISDGTTVAGALWLTAAHSSFYWNGSAFTSTAPTTDPDMYHSGDPAAVTDGFLNLHVGDVVFLGNTRGAATMPATDDGNREWNPNNPYGQQRDLVSYRWYKVLDKSADQKQICIFPAQHAFHDREQFFVDNTNTVRYPLKHAVAAYDGPYATANTYGDSHSIPTYNTASPHTNPQPNFPAQKVKSCKLYCGDIQLSGLKFTQKRHLSGTIGRFRQLRDDFRHIYVMWADMRNDGSADADGGYRKDKFGLVYPTVDNYDVSLVYSSSQEDIIELKMGEDLDIWSMDSNDPYTSQRWSNNRTNTIEGDYDYANILHNWEDKAGAFLIIDASKFFNLNTYANNGRIGQSAGGEKDLDGITAQSEGFPELMDNYWWWAMPHPYTAKYRLPYDPTWRFVVRYATKVASDIDNGKPIINLDSSPYYQGSYFDEMNIRGSYEFIQYSNDAEAQDAGMQVQEFPVGGTWSNTMGCFVTDYDEMASTAAKRLYIGTGSRIMGGEETLAMSFANTTPYENFGMETMKPINDHTIFSNWAATHALPLMMSIEGHIETPASNTFWEHDKVRLLWQKANQKTWLSGGRYPLSYDISEVPIANDFDTTHQGTTNTALIDSYGSTYDGRGQTVRRIISSVQQQSGASYTNNIPKKWHFSIERGRFTYRPSYSSFLTLNRDNLIKSDLATRSSKTADHVRVLYNGGSSFVDYPQAALNDDAQSSKWKLIDASNVSSASEAYALAVQNYESAKKGSFKVTGRMIRESGQTHLMNGGRHGYIATPCIRSLPSSSTEAIGTSTLHQHSLTAGCLFPGRVNALDGNLDGLLYLNRVGSKGSANVGFAFGNVWDEMYVGQPNDSEYYKEGRGNHGSGTCDAFSVSSAPTGATGQINVPAHQSYGWYGVASVDKAVQVVSVTKDFPLTSAGTMNDLRIMITHNSNTANEGKYTIWLIDIKMEQPSSPSSAHGLSLTEFSWVQNTTETNVQANGYVELPIPQSYGATPESRITVSFNRDYCDSLLKYRSHNADASKSNKGNRISSPMGGTAVGDYNALEHSFNKNSIINEGSAFPLGLPEFADGDDNKDRGGFWWLHKARAIYYLPSIHIVKDFVWRPGRLVNYVDNHLDIAEELLVASVKYNLQGQKHEQVELSLKRDDAQQVTGRGFMLPNLGSSYKNRPEPPAPPAGGGESGGDDGGAPSGGGGGGGGSGPVVPPFPFPPNGGPVSGGGAGSVIDIMGNMISSPHSNIVYTTLAGLSGRGLAIGAEATTVIPMGSEGTHDVGETGSSYGTRSQSTVGAPPQDGGFGAGATSTSNRISIQNITKGAFNTFKGKGDLLGEAGIEGQSGLLGVNKNKSSYMHNTETSEMAAVAQSKTVTSGSANITANGFSLPGRSSFTEGVAMSNFDYHEFAMTLSTPKGTTGKKLTVKAKVNAPATTGNDTAASYSLYTTVTCVETGATIEHQTDFTGVGNTKEIILMPTKNLEGVDVEGNTLEIRVGRSPGSTTMPETYNDSVITNDENFGGDNAQFEAVEVSGIKIYTEKKKAAPSFKRTTTSKLRMKDNTVGLFSGTNAAFQLEGGEEGATQGQVDRTNEGSGQSSGRKVDGSVGEGDDDPYSSIIS